LRTVVNPAFSVRRAFLAPIKVCATGGVLSLGDNPQASQYTLEEMKAIVADAHRLGRKVAAHAHGAEGIRWATEAGV
jgi:imidazolonepropionase-like amidohydrolase